MTAATVVKILEKYLWSIPPATLLKNELLHSYFSKILINFKKKCFFRTSLSNCVFRFMNFYFCWHIDFFYFRVFLGIFYLNGRRIGFFWRRFCLFFNAVYQCEHIFRKLGRRHPLFWEKWYFLRGVPAHSESWIISCPCEVALH